MKQIHNILSFMLILLELIQFCRKPFVVVPCCVFPNLFRSRYLEGRPVRSYEQFCQYLYEKDPRLNKEVLPFEGRNIAIWWKP